MSWKKMAVAGIALCVSAAVAGAQGTPPSGGPPPGQGGPGGPRGGRGMQMLFEGITLTDAQQAKVDSISTKYRAERQSLFPNGRPAGPPDDATRQKMTELMGKESAEIRAILTADQQKLFDANVEKRKQMMQQRQQ